ncbi:MAG: hypothetical protein MJZ34_06475 [Paludibacteraceae bacterium]|nr:hypothetical protein [Paludibacteraceae bacterium]
MKMNVNNDAMGNRISKTVINKNMATDKEKSVTTYYVRDPQGKVLAVYEHKRGESGNGTFTLTEQHLYGASRLGMRKRDLALNATNASESTPPVTHYELTNHLGNVMAVISDETSATAEPAVVSLSDYYPFGMTEPGRSWNAGDYRFGYTGHEKGNDMAEGVYTTEYRLLDTRLGRWMSVDPLAGDFAWMSPYNYCGGNPIVMVDPYGMSTKVADNGNGTYTVIGGSLEDKDRNIYVYSKDKEGKYTIKGKSIGFTLTITSFWDADKNDWAKGTKIDPSDRSGIEFLDDLTCNNIPTLTEYMTKGGNDQKYDFKWTNGTNIADHDRDKYRGMPIGENGKGEIMFASARDVGNFGAGYIAGINGLDWKSSRVGFDTYQSYKSKELTIEGITTRNAEYKGWLTGQARSHSYKAKTFMKSITDVKSIYEFFKHIFK